MIDDRIKRAIGRLEAIWADRRQPTTGTAFLASSRHILTAFHVIADRTVWVETGERRFADRIHFTLSDSRRALRAMVIADCVDGHLDWALLELESEVSGIDPVPLGDLEGADRRAPSVFECWGYPVAGLSAQGGVVVGGRVKDWDAAYQGVRAIELHSDFPAPTLRGLSGAPCIVDGAAIGILRATLAMSETATYVGATAYACPVSSLGARCWDLIPPPDPLWGLPGLPPATHLPPKPFRDLRWYDEEHAALFFGRGQATREIYLRLVERQRPRLVYLYGHSGVGKSSLLRAGLYPRIRSRMAVSIGRRLAAEPLAVTFERLREAATPLGDQAPTLVVLDQVEEAYADARKADADEDLARLLSAVRGALDGAPELRVLLTFRAEWLAELKTAAEFADLLPAYMHLLPLDEDGIEQVVLGVRRTALSRVYDMGVDDGLARRVSGWLLSDNRSPISPMLSIVMTRLWDRAEKSGRRALSLEAFDAMAREKLDLDQFVQDQIGKVQVQHPEAVDSGLVLDLLFSLTTEHGTTQAVAANQLVAAYEHTAMRSGAPELQRVLTCLEAHSLVCTTTQPDGSVPVKRLAHDTLATPIRKAFAASVQPGQKARRLLEARAAVASDSTASAIDAAALGTILEGLHGMRELSGQEQRMVETAKAARETAQAERDAATAALEGIKLAKVARSRLIRRSALVVSLILGVLCWFLATEAIRSSAAALSGRGLALVADKRPDLGLPLLRLAYSLEDTLEIRESLMNAHRMTKGLVRTWHPFGHGAIDRPPAYITHDDLFDTVAFPSLSGFVMGRLPKNPPSSDDWFKPVGVADARMVALDRDGKCLAVATWSKVHVVATPDKRCGRVKVFDFPTDHLSAVALAETQVFAGTQDGRLLIWSDSAERPDVRALPCASTFCEVTHIAISRDGTTVAVGVQSGNVWVDAPEHIGKSAPLPSSRVGTLNAIAISNDGRSVAVIRDTEPAVVDVWQRKTDRFEIPIPGSSGASAAFSLDGRFLAIGRWNGSLWLYDLQKQKRFVEYPVQLGSVMRLHFNANGSELTAWTIRGALQTFATTAYPSVEVSGLRGHLHLVKRDDTVALLADQRVRAAFRHAPEGWLLVDPAKELESGERSLVDERSRRAARKALDLSETIASPTIWMTAPSGLDKAAALDVASKSIRGRVMSSSTWKAEPSVYGAKDLRFARHGGWLVTAEDEFVRFLDAGNGQRVGPSWTTGEPNLVQRLLVDDSGGVVIAASDSRLSVWPTPETSLAEVLSAQVPAVSDDETEALLGPVMSKLILGLAKLRSPGP